MTRPTPRVVLGMPLFNPGANLIEAVESLMAQTFEDFALVIVDDCSIDASAERLGRYLERDDRLRYVVNRRRLGMIGNWRRCFEVGRELYGDFPYYAWVSDHDAWHPRWLAELVATLERDPDIVLAYPRAVTTAAMDEVDAKTWLRPGVSFETTGETNVRRRAARAQRGMQAGNMIYGLFRSEVVEQSGIFRTVLEPDRLLVFEASLRGQFAQVPEVLFYRRRFGFKPTRDRQRRSLYGGGVPLSAHLSPTLVHGAAPARADGPRTAAGYMARGALAAAGRRWRWYAKTRTRRHPIAVVTWEALAGAVRPGRLASGAIIGGAEDDAAP
jgi:glycosyltransferase involved in cell wall biosynthesis